MVTIRTYKHDEDGFQLEFKVQSYDKAEIISEYKGILNAMYDATPEVFELALSLSKAVEARMSE